MVEIDQVIGGIGKEGVALQRAMAISRVVQNQQATVKAALCAPEGRGAS